MTTVHGFNTLGKLYIAEWGSERTSDSKDLRSDHVLRTLAHELHHFSVSKGEVGWDLEEIETVSVYVFVQMKNVRKMYNGTKTFFFSKIAKEMQRSQEAE